MREREKETGRQNNRQTDEDFCPFAQHNKKERSEHS